MYSRILVPIDGSACSREAITHGIAIAKAMGSLVMFLFVLDTYREWDEGERLAEIREKLAAQGRTHLDEAQQWALRERVRSGVELEEGTAVDVIARRAAEFDLVIMATRSRSLLKRVAVGSVTRGVLHRTTRPVLVVHCVPPR
jgi:nucleotide-binding universal stress UspA family protein